MNSFKIKELLLRDLSRSTINPPVLLRRDPISKILVKLTPIIHPNNTLISRNPIMSPCYRPFPEEIAASHPITKRMIHYLRLNLGNHLESSMHK